MKRWTKEEDDILINSWTKLSKEELMFLLPDRSWSAIQIHAQRLNLHGRRRNSYPPPLDILPKFELDEKEQIQLAMMIDCEGTISLRKHKDGRISPVFCISNTSFDLVKRFKEITRTLNKIGCRVRNERKKPEYYLDIGSMSYVYHLLCQIKDYLIVKQKQAELVMRFIEIQDERSRTDFSNEYSNYTEEQIEIYNKIRELNGGIKHV